MRNLIRDRLGLFLLGIALVISLHDLDSRLVSLTRRIEALECPELLWNPPEPPPAPEPTLAE